MAQINTRINYNHVFSTIAHTMLWVRDIWQERSGMAEAGIL